MGLKTIHVMFVAVAILLAVGTGVWAVLDYRGSHRTESVAMAVVSFTMGAALLGYGVWFLRKLKGIRFN